MVSEHGRHVGSREQSPFKRPFYTPDRIRNLGCPLDSLRVSLSRRAKLGQVLTGQEKSQCGPGRTRIVFTPYWTTFELPATDTRVAPVGILDRIVAGLRPKWRLRKS